MIKLGSLLRLCLSLCYVLLVCSVLCDLRVIGSICWGVYVLGLLYVGCDEVFFEVLSY